MRPKCYSELRHLHSFDERFDYLNLYGHVGDVTFGSNRWINQKFYTSREWKRIRDHVIARDYGCDLGIEGFEIHTDILVHHMNPMSVDDVRHSEEWILDPEFLITTTKNTHNAIHFGDVGLLPKTVLERSRGDTKLW